jgi:putative Mn2+ efflux pump MntP
MNLDLRLPIGLMFSIFGVLLTLFGLVSDQAIYAQSLGINVNLWWGLVLLGFGFVMLAFALRAARKRTSNAG